MLWVLFLYILLVVYGLVGARDGIFALVVTRILLRVGQVLPALLYDFSSPFSLSLSLFQPLYYRYCKSYYHCRCLLLFACKNSFGRRTYVTACPLNNWCHLGTKNAYRYKSLGWILHQTRWSDIRTKRNRESLLLASGRTVCIIQIDIYKFIKKTSTYSTFHLYYFSLKERSYLSSSVYIYSTIK